MPVPSPRNKILPVRGNIATLQANLASLVEGEICYALDEDQYYQKEGGVLVSVGATKAQGVLADSAIQPLDNVSELTNDAGYVDAAGASAAAPVQSVAGKTGTVTLVKGDVGLGNVDNTSDLNKPISTATQNALDLKADLISGVIPNSQLPSLAVTEYLGTVASEAAMLALTGQRGDWAIRTDTSTTWVITNDGGSLISDWTELATPPAGVSSVNGYTGTVILSAADVGAATAAQGATADTALQPGDRISAAAGTASSPGVYFDANSGLYSPGANQVALSTNGAGRLFVDASGNVDISSSNPTLKIASTSSQSPGIVLERASGADYNIVNDLGVIRLRKATDSSTWADLYSFASDSHILKTNDTERLRITSAGNVGIGATSPFTTLSVFKNIVGGNPQTSGSTDSNVFTRLQGGSVGLDFGGTTAGTQWIQPRLISDFSANFGLSLCPNGGNVGIGTTSPVSPLHIQKSAVSSAPVRAGATLYLENDSNCELQFVGNSSNDCQLRFGTSSNSFKGAIEYQLDNNALVSYVNGVEATRIDSSGRLLVGTSSFAFIGGGIIPTIQVENTSEGTSAISVKNNQNNAGGARLLLGKSRGSTVASNTIVQENDTLGRVDFAGADGTDTRNTAASVICEVDGTPGADDMPGRLVFSTTADGASSPTERMRINSDGAVIIGTNAAASNEKFFINQIAGFARGSDGETIRFYRSAVKVGNISLTATSTAYNTSSDYRLKENVIPVTDGITRLQQLKPSRFNFIADPAKTVDGFLAHEVQTIVPEAITGEKDAVDEDGNPQYQGIDQSKLVPLLTAALQEAIGEIESLKARVAALESA